MFETYKMQRITAIFSSLCFLLHSFVWEKNKEGPSYSAVDLFSQTYANNEAMNNEGELFGFQKNLINFNAQLNQMVVNKRRQDRKY